MPPLAIVGQQAMDVAAGNSAIPANRSRVVARQIEEGRRGTRRASDMHFVALERHAVRGARDLDQHLVALQHRVDWQQAEPFDGRRRALNALRIGDAAAKHLVAAADAQHLPAAPHMRLQVDVPAVRAQGGEIGDGRLRARQDHQRRVAGDRLARPHEHQVDPRLQPQRIEVVEVGDARIGKHDDLHAAAASRGRQAERVLSGQAMRLGEERQQAERRPARAPLDVLHAVGKERGIATKAVDDEAHDHRRIGRIDHRLRADDAGDHAAAVDVAQQHDRHVGSTREAHVRNIRFTQVDLRRRARTLDQHEVGLGAKLAETLQHRAEQLGLHRLVVARLGVADDLALHDDLGADLALGFQQHRVHVDAGRHPRGARLQRLGATDLAAVGRHRRVVRHVLRLERPHFQAAPREGAGEACHQQRLADIGARALDHEGAGAHQNSMPSCAFTPAAKWCFTGVISVTRSAASISSGLALRPVTTMCRSRRRACNAATTNAISRWS